MFKPTPIAIAQQQLIQRCVSDGRRIGIALPYNELISKNLPRSLHATWCAPRRMWVVPHQPAEQLALQLNRLYSDLAGVYNLGETSSQLALTLRQAEKDYFVEVLDTQIFRLVSGGYAVISRFDSLVIQAMHALHGMFHKFASAWVVNCNIEKILESLLQIAGVCADFIFIHEQPLYLEKLGSGEKSSAPIAVPAAPPPSAARGAKEEAGDGFLSAYCEPTARLKVDNTLLMRVAAETNLRDYQVEGVRFLLQRTGGLLGDDMGLGKTRQSIVAGRLAAGFGPEDRVLVLCPSSLRINWEREIISVFPSAIVGMVGEDRLPTLFGCHWVIANYDRLGSIVKEVGLHFKVMLVDEAHYLKEHEAGRTRNAFVMASRIPRRFLITGTPLLNRVIELHTLLRLSGHPLGTMTLTDFRKTYGSGKEGSAALAKSLSSWMIRRRKDVLTDFGKKHRQLRYISPAEGLGAYKNILADMSLGVMPKIVKLRQCLEALKLEFVYESILGLGQLDKVIVFVEYMPTVDALKRALTAADIAHVSLVGSDSNKARQRAVDEFQSNPSCRVFITTRAAGGVGITLVAANYVLFCSLPWNPALLRQAEDRAYRLGQRRDVFVLIPLIPDTIDQQVWDLLGSKCILEEEVIESVVEENEIVATVANTLAIGTG